MPTLPDHDDSVTVTCIETPQLFADLAHEWDVLCDSIPTAPPFLSYDWMRAWWEVWGRLDRLLIIVVRDSCNRLIAIAPLYIATDPLMQLKTRVIRFLGHHSAGADYLCMLVQPGWETQAVEAVVRELIVRRNSWDYIELDHIVLTYQIFAVLVSTFEARSYTITRTRRYVCPFAELPHNFEEYLRSRSPNVRYNFRRRLKALQRDGRLAVTILQHAKDIRLRFGELGRLHAARFACQAKRTSFLAPKVQEFHRVSLTNESRTLNPRLFLLEARGVTVAALYGYAKRDRFYFFQSGMDPQWSNRSVGLVLMGLVIEHAIKQGHREYDFLRGEEAYKFQWATGSRCTHTIRIYGNSLRARWASAYFKWVEWVSCAKKVLRTAFTRKNAISGMTRRDLQREATSGSDAT